MALSADVGLGLDSRGDIARMLFVVPPTGPGAPRSPIDHAFTSEHHLRPVKHTDRISAPFTREP